MASATAVGACRACSGGSASRARRRDLGTRGAARPSGPRSKKELGSKLAEVAEAHPGARVQLWCEDEARVGQKGRVCHRWYERGVRPPGLADKRFESLDLFAACRPGTDQAFALALPEATTAAMSLFLAAFAEQLEPDAHAVLILDQAGWHGSRRLAVPGNITLLPLPAYSPELNPVERVWLYLRERFLSHRVLDGYKAVLDAACDAWNALAAETGRLTSLTAYPYLLRSELR
jgi:transposase